MLSNPSKFFVALAVTGLFALPTLPLAEGADSPSAIAWGNDVNEALRQSAQTGRPVLLHFYSDNCLPCKMLDAKTFKNPTVGEAMDRTVIPVKIHYDKNRDLAKRYLITRFPTDLFLHPNGEEIYRTVSPQDPADYTKLLDRIAIRNRDWVVERMSKLANATPSQRPTAPSPLDTASLHDGRSIATHSPLFHPTTKTSPSNDLAPVDTDRLVPEYHDAAFTTGTENTIRNPFHLASHTTEARENRYQRPSSSQPVDPARIPAAAESVRGDDEAMASVTMGGVFADDTSLGLDGFCPVTLTLNKAWHPGNEAYSVKHRGRIYRCVSEEARALFLQDADRYSPVLSGYDLVHFLETGELIAGRREFGCYSSDRVFVFMNAANKTHFEGHVQQYTRNLRPTEATQRVANDSDSPTLIR